MMVSKTTLYLDRDEFRDDIRRLKIEYETAKRADKADIHQAIVDVGLEHEDEVLDKLYEQQGDSE